ncbi:hypothetical protein G9A89_002172 [Geosiphon pyriformis]|nr:hypothetical protein G9A89_002172 [Geosiphon pyriformis]
MKQDPITEKGWIKHVLWPLHFEKKCKNKKWANSHVMASSLTIAKLMSGSLTGYKRRKNSSPETQADNSVHAVSIDPSICALFTWYSPKKAVSK